MASLLNGLKAFGESVAGTAERMGLEEQKSQLARQTLELADNLATRRESTGRQEAGDIAERQARLTDTLIGGRESAGRRETAQFTSEENRRQEEARSLEAEKNRTSTASIERAREQASLERKLLEINAPPDVIKVLRELGQLPASSSTPSPTSKPAADGTESPLASKAAPTPDINNPLIAKALGLPMAGSEAAVRQAIADDVKKDPGFKYKTLGEQAAEIEQRLALSKKTDLTERQGKSALFADRMFEANNVMNEVVKANPNADTWIERRLDKAGNYIGTTGLNTSDYQRIRRAKEDFLTAVLRDESGALIGEPEFVRDEKKYFPQPGDGPEVIADKARARELAVKGLAREAGSTYKTPERPAPGKVDAEKGASASDPLSMARDAIGKGAPRDAVIKRLRENGIDPGGL